MRNSMQRSGWATAQSSGEVLWRAGAEPSCGRIARAILRSKDDVGEIEKYSHEQLLPARTILDCVASAADANPDKPAMIFLPSADLSDTPRIVSYAELVTSIRRAANLFKNAAGAERSVVALILPMLPEGLIALWGASTAGIAVPINPHLEMEHVTSILNSVKATVLVTTTKRYGSGSWNNLDTIIASVPTLRRVLIVDADRAEDDFAKAVAAYPAELSFAPDTNPHAEAMYMPTGGTTGTPKLVRMTHWGQLVISWNVGALMGSTFDGVVGHGMPNFHCGGTISLGLRTIIYGQTLLTLTPDGFRNQQVIRNFWDIARRYRMTSVLATPTTAAAILAAPDAIADGHSMTDFHCGGSVVPMELVRRFHEKFGVWLRENWGLTEVHGTATGHPGTDRMPVVGSVGCALPHYRVKAIEVDKDNAFTRECAPGERGALVIGGPSLMLGYNNSSLNQQFFVSNMPDGKPWANTGDLGTVDENGYVWVSGRAKDLIIRGGHNIDPRVIEEALLKHDAVHIVAAVGRPDASKGELPIAYVELKKGADVDPQELIRFCAEHCQERASIPIEIIILDTIPLTAVGKVSKPTLQVDAIKRTVKFVAARVLGEGTNFDLSIDESGRRPAAILQLTTNVADRDRIRSELLDAFAGFEFVTDVRLPAD